MKAVEHYHAMYLLNVREKVKSCKVPVTEDTLHTIMPVKEFLF